MKVARGNGAGAGLAFNHAMIYSRDVEAALRFYKEQLGFRLIEESRYQDRLVYARLKAPRGDNTIALHALQPGEELHPGGIRLYFETPRLEKLCERLQAQGVAFSKGPKLMPWGWVHAYLDDPDGHEVSLYRAGVKRLRKTPAPSGAAANKPPSHPRRPGAKLK